MVVHQIQKCARVVHSGIRQPPNSAVIYRVSCSRPDVSNRWMSRFTKLGPILSYTSGKMHWYPRVCLRAYFGIFRAVHIHWLFGEQVQVKDYIFTARASELCLLYILNEPALSREACGYDFNRAIPHQAALWASACATALKKSR